MLFMTSLELETYKIVEDIVGAISYDTKYCYK